MHCGHEPERNKMNRVIIEVSGGIAYCAHLPPGITVEIHDYDNATEDLQFSTQIFSKDENGASIEL